MGDFWKNAFAIDHERERTFTDEEKDLCRRLAEKIVRHGMALPAILFLETARPMNFIGSQALAFFEPIVKGLFSWEDYTGFRIVLEQRGSVELILRSIEEAEAERTREIAKSKAEGRPGLILRTFRRLKEKKKMKGDTSPSKSQSKENGK